MTKFPKDHPYMIRLDKALKNYFVCKVTDANGAEQPKSWINFFCSGEDYNTMKEEILDALFIPPEEIRK